MPARSRPQRGTAPERRTGPRRTRSDPRRPPPPSAHPRTVPLVPRSGRPESRNAGAATATWCSRSRAVARPAPRRMAAAPPTCPAYLPRARARAAAPTAGPAAPIGRRCHSLPHGAVGASRRGHGRTARGGAEGDGYQSSAAPGRGDQAGAARRAPPVPSRYPAVEVAPDAPAAREIELRDEEGVSQPVVIHAPGDAVGGERALRRGVEHAQHARPL